MWANEAPRPAGEVVRRCGVREHEVGALIGKGGSHIRSVAGASGAKLELASRPPDGALSTDLRALVISGTAVEVASAATLISRAGVGLHSLVVTEEHAPAQCTGTGTDAAPVRGSGWAPPEAGESDEEDLGEPECGGVATPSAGGVGAVSAREEGAVAREPGLPRKRGREKKA